MYVSVPSMSAKTIESKINKVWKDISKRRGIDYSTTKRYVASNTDLAKFYFLVKTHKSGNEVKIRPIVSNVNCPTTKISWLLDKALKPLLDSVEAHTESTNDLIKRLTSRSPEVKEKYTYPFSLDVVNLFTSIPQEGIVSVIKDLLDQQSYSFYHLGSEDIIKLLECVLANNYFMFDGVIYKQRHGLAMGSSVSDILAILYMGHVETVALRDLGTRVGFYSCLLYTSPSPRDLSTSRMPSSA